MNLDTLVQTFRNQATSTNSIILNSDVLPQTELDKLSTAFLLGKNKFLTVTNITAADIPNPVNGTLQISAGTTTVLKQTNVGPALTFTVDANGAVQYLIAAKMSDSWSFTDSFPNLTVFPFKQVKVSKTFFVYSSLPKDSYAPWSDKPTETISLKAGLNFASWMTLNIFSGALTLLQQILSATLSYKISGPFAPDDVNPYPVTTLTLPLANETFKITDDLSIGNLSLIIDISTPGDSFQDIEMSLAASTGDLVFSVGISESDPALTFAAVPMTGHQVTANEIIALPGGAGFQQYIPTAFNDAFKDCALKEFSITLTDTSAVSFISFSIATVAGYKWAVIPNVLTLGSITLELAFFDPFGTNDFSEISMGASCQLFPSIFPGTFDFTLDMDNAGPNQSWQVTTISGNYYGSAKLGDFVSAIAGTSARVPQELSDITFSDFGVDVIPQDSGYVYSLTGECSAAFPMLGAELISTLTVGANYSKLGYDVDLSGTFLINEQNFGLELQLNEVGGAPSTGFVHASWNVVGTDYLQFADIARAFDFSDDEIPIIPEGLDLSLKSAALTYDFGKQQLGIGFESANWGSAVFAAMQNPSNQNKWQFFFGLAINKPISLTHLPVVENFLPADDNIEVNQIQVVLSSYQIDGKLAGSINTLIASLGSSYPQVPNSDNKGMAAGVNFSLNVAFGSSQFPVVFGTGPVSAPQDSSSSTALLATTDQASGPPSSPSSAKWFTVGKTFGPVSFQRVGVQYQNSKLFFLLDASLTLSDFTLGMNGLGVGSPLTNFAPEAHIDGISVSFSSGSVTVAGGFLVAPPPLPPGVTEEYLGSVAIGIEPYQIAGVGSYAKVDGNSSVFIFAQVLGSFGGPPAFFITGFMGGLGYNSHLTLPEADQVLNFPFVAGLDNPAIFGSTNPTPLDVMNVLTGSGGKTVWVTPTTGETWIAAGVMFRSFEIVLGRVLLVVSFGKDFEVALLGLASMSLPQGATKDAYAYVELQLAAVFKPDEGFFSIIGSVTPNSYLLTRDCHLTGGFAFCYWFGSNPHAGDFVVTVGGYHPGFTVPSWYPQVPRLGFNWNVGGGVTIKGDCYFALTPTAAMAGGSLEVLYQSGNLRCWFTAYANLMIRWKPFYFTASIGVSIGASYRLNLLFTTTTVSVEMGATLKMWGPPTGGTVYIDWYIISFSVSFGADPIAPAQMTLNWGDFQSLLPNNQPAATPAPLLMGTASPLPAVVLGVNINEGLTSQDSSGKWIVRADELVFTTQTAVPASELRISGKVLPLPAGAPNKINIRPMKQTGVSSVHSVTLTSVDEKKDIDLSTWPQHVAQTGNLPEALWGEPISDSSTPAPAAATIPNLTTGIQFEPPPAAAGPSVGPVDPSSLIDPLGGGYQPLKPTTQKDPIPAPVIDANSITLIMTTLAAPATLQTQQSLVAALQRFGAGPPTSAPLTQLAQQAGSLFSQAPLRAA
jgi:hypothetical protein